MAKNEGHYRKSTWAREARSSDYVIDCYKYYGKPVLVLHCQQRLEEWHNYLFYAS